jgi:cell division protein FtsQ
MDGGRRFLRSLKESFATLFASGYPRAAAAGIAVALPVPSSTRPRASASRPTPRRSVSGGLARAAAVAALPGIGLAATFALFASVGWAGFVQSGGYADLVRREGDPRDILARALGFPIDAVTISGQSQIREAEVLAASGIGSHNSLVFLDAEEVRRRLMQLPLVKSARVLKLYPDRLVIAIEERQPYALWQRDGHVAIVDSEGKTIDRLRDDRFIGLPFVVGEGAEKRLPEYVALLGAAADLAPRVKAGVLVAGRRWTFNMADGVQVKLPEQDPGAALSTLQRLQREARILDKDVLSIDLRIPGRVIVRLTEDGALARAAAQPRKSVKSGSHT